MKDNIRDENSTKIPEMKENFAMGPRIEPIKIQFKVQDHFMNPNKILVWVRIHGCFIPWERNTWCHYIIHYTYLVENFHLTDVPQVGSAGFQIKANHQSGPS